MRYEGHLIKSVDPGSIAEELELEPGDRLMTINGHEIEDIFDYDYYVDSEEMLMVVEKKDGELWELEIENDYEDLGINFENGLLSDYKSCSNKCIFCFIDQMPPGMRETLYFKDDDSRLSFLQGNYITLTNMKDHDIQRIIDFKLAPINISVHTTNPKLRCEMLHNRFAGDALKKIDTLFRHEIPMNGQIVLCREINDGAELERTIHDLTRYIPCMESVSVVPVGLSKYRDGLYPLKPFDKESAAAALEIIERWQKKIYAEHGIHFIHASDEFYLLAERELPEEERYDGYPQLENGVGMLRLLDTEVTQALEEMSEDTQIEAQTLSLATGRLAFPTMQRQIAKITAKYPQIKVNLYAIRNDFFGEMITVSGLVTGQDIKKQLSGCELGSRLLLPSNMFRSGEEVFLDDVTRSDVQTALQVPVNIVKSSGQDLVNAVLYPDITETVEYEGYELKEL
jgi:putative radical SAM enzyme (TIGR03279 family)